MSCYFNDLECIDINVSDLYDANLGFVIAEPSELNDTDDEYADLPYIQEIISEDREQEYFVNIATSGYVPDEHGHPVYTQESNWIPTWALTENLGCYFTVVGETPVFEPQATVVDKNRTANELYDLRNTDEFTGLQCEINIFKLEQMLAKDPHPEVVKRRERLVRISKWIKRQTDASKLLKARREFRTKLSANRAECAKTNNWLCVALTKEQSREIEHLFAVQLKRLPYRK